MHKTPIPNIFFTTSKRSVRSERPLTIMIFKLISETGYNIIAKDNNFNNGATSSHLSVNKKEIIGVLNAAIAIIIGNTI